MIKLFSVGIDLFLYFLALLIIFHSQYTYHIPTATPFQHERAWADLKEIANTSHPYGSLGHDQVEMFLKQKLMEIKLSALNFTEIELHLDDKTETVLMANDQDQKVRWLFESQNIWVKVKGSNGGDSLKNGKNTAILVSGHYDSGAFSHGAADDGMSCAVMLEILRLIVERQQTFHHDVIFLFNSPEEIGLLGSVSFAAHPETWDQQNIIGFVNIEAAGVSGKEFLFRALGSEMIDLFAETAPYPHSNVIGNDVFKLGIVRGDTDYRVYAREKGVPGIDLAFYQGRPFYHTRFDRIDHLTPFSVWHMGTNVYSYIQQLAQTSVKTADGQLYKQAGSIYYDLAGRSMLSYSFITGLSISCTLIAITLLKLLFKNRSWKPVKSFFYQTLMVILIVTSCMALGWIVKSVNTPVPYSYAWTFFFSLLFWSLLICVTMIEFTPFGSSVYDRNDILDGLELFYCMLQIVNIALNSNGVGMLFFISWWHGFLLCSRLIYDFFNHYKINPDVAGYQKVVEGRQGQNETSAEPTSPVDPTSPFFSKPNEEQSSFPQHKNFWKRNYVEIAILLSAGCQIVMPALITWEFTSVLIETIGASVNDGASPVTVGAFYGFIVVFLILPLLKSISILSKFEQRYCRLLLTLLSLILMLVCLCVFPFTEDKPVRGVYTQIYNFTEPASPATSFMFRGAFQDYFKRMVSDGGMELTSTERLREIWWRYNLDYEKHPLYGPDKNFNVTRDWPISTRLDKSIKKAWVNITYPPGSKLCMLHTQCSNCTVNPIKTVGAETVPSFQFSDIFAFAGYSLPIYSFFPEETNTTLTFVQAASLKREWNSRAEFEVQWSSEDELRRQPMMLFVSCNVDEVTDNQLSFLSEFQERMPKWSLLMGLGSGMAALTRELYFDLSP